MNRFHVVTIGMAAATSSLAAGPLDPPAGPISSTMKSLDVVEPRTQVNDETAPGDAGAVFRIVEPGSYYLTANVIGQPTKVGIEIASSEVTLDLMGFSVRADTGGTIGIAVDGECDAIAIRNGVVTGWSQQGVALGLGEGRVLDGVHCTDNGTHGMLTGGAAIISGCSATGNGSHGIIAGNASVLDRCAASGNGGTGIMALVGAVVTDCSSRDDGAGGYLIEQGGSVEGSTAVDNQIGGFFVRNGTRVTDCLARENIGDGINAGDECIIIGNTVTRNEGDGIETDGDSIIKDNVASFNRTSAGDGAGIRVQFHASRIEGNLLRVNDLGMDIMHTHNFVVRNSAVTNTTNYRIVPSNRVGTIVNAPGVSTMINGNTGGGLGTFDPWANFAF